MAELYQGKFSGEEIDSAIEKIEAIQGLPTGGTTGQVVTKTDGGAEWADAPKEIPDGGTDGQILSKTATGTTWIDNIKITSLGRASSSSNPTLTSSYFPSMTIIDDYNTKIRHCIIDPPSRIGQTTDEGVTTPNLSQFKNTSKLTTDFIFNNMPENPFKNNGFAYQSFPRYLTVNQGNEQRYVHDFYSINTHYKRLSVTTLTGYTSAETPSPNITPANSYQFILSIPPNI